MQFSFARALALLSATSCLAKASSCDDTQCPPLPPGDILFHNQPALYPVYFEFDPVRCVLYVGSIYNATVAVWDPYKSTLLHTISIPGISHPATDVVSDKRLPALRLNADASILSFIVQAGSEFYLTLGANVSGDNFLMQYDLNKNELVTETNLTETTQAAYGAFVDFAQASPEDGSDYYVLGSYPSTILRVNPSTTMNSTATEYYVPKPITLPRKYGFGGTDILDDHIYTNDNSNSQLVRFNLSNTTSSSGTPETIQTTPQHTFIAATGLSFLQKYNNTILLMAESLTPKNTTGVSVYRSCTAWASAEYLGFIPARQKEQDPTAAASQVLAREIQGRVFASVLYNDNTVALASAGNRSEFSFADITFEVDGIVDKAGACC